MQHIDLGHQCRVFETAPIGMGTELHRLGVVRSMKSLSGPACASGPVVYTSTHRTKQVLMETTRGCTSQSPDANGGLVEILTYKLTLCPTAERGTEFGAPSLHVTAASTLNASFR